MPLSAVELCIRVLLVDLADMNGMERVQVDNRFDVRAVVSVGIDLLFVLPRRV